MPGDDGMCKARFFSGYCGLDDRKSIMRLMCIQLAMVYVHRAIHVGDHLTSGDSECSLDRIDRRDTLGITIFDVQ